MALHPHDGTDLQKKKQCFLIGFFCLLGLNKNTWVVVFSFLGIAWLRPKRHNTHIHNYIDIYRW